MPLLLAAGCTLFCVLGHCLFAMLGIKLGVLCMLGKCSTQSHNSSPVFHVLVVCVVDISLCPLLKVSGGETAGPGFHNVGCNSVSIGASLLELCGHLNGRLSQPCFQILSILPLVWAVVLDMYRFPRSTLGREGRLKSSC
jgi:hypothetical protein